jgi:hypothetical protein
LVEDQFKPRGRGGVKEVEDLLDIEIAGDRKMLEGGVFAQKAGGEGVCDVEGEVTDELKVWLIAEEVECAEIADQDAVGFEFFDQAEVSDLTGFLDAWCGEKDRRCVGVCASELKGVFEAANVLKVDVDRGQIEGEGSFNLFEGTAQDAKCRRDGGFGDAFGEELLEVEGGWSGALRGRGGNEAFDKGAA